MTMRRATKAKVTRCRASPKTRCCGLNAIRPEQHFTEPPPRYTEATLVKDLEEKGIGRPSTYAAIISTIVEREYVKKDQGRFTPTMLGERVSMLLVKSFEDVFDVTFTARLEEELDEIEDGKLHWREAVKEFWEKFIVDLDRAGDEMLSTKRGYRPARNAKNAVRANCLSASAVTDFSWAVRAIRIAILFRIFRRNWAKTQATKTKSNIATIAARKWLSSAAALACFLRAPAIRIAKPRGDCGRHAHRAAADEPLDEKCPACESGLVKKHGRFGEFIGCTGYPKCKYTRPITMGIKCPKCHEGEFVRRGSAGRGGRPRIFYGCSRYPDCDFTTPSMPIAEPCPKCGSGFYRREEVEDWNAARLHQRRLRLGKVDRRAGATGKAGRSRRTGRRKILDRPSSSQFIASVRRSRRTQTKFAPSIPGSPRCFILKHTGEEAFAVHNETGYRQIP